MEMLISNYPTKLVSVAQTCQCCDSLGQRWVQTFSSTLGKAMGSILNPIPSGVVAHIGGMNGRIRFYNLWKDGEILVIQAPPLVPPDLEPGYLYSPPAEFSARITREHLFGLECLVRIPSVIWLLFSHY
jgi:hypothetical protein